MNITSTEFQQNVGYYLKQAEQGKTITIRKLKPKKSSFELIAKNVENVNKKNKRNGEIRALIKELKINNTGESGLEFQRRVRS